jgi:hypothetical protein
VWDGGAWDGTCPPADRSQDGFSPRGGRSPTPSSRHRREVAWPRRTAGSCRRPIDARRQADLVYAELQVVVGRLEPVPSLVEEGAVQDDTGSWREATSRVLPRGRLWGVRCRSARTALVGIGDPRYLLVGERLDGHSHRGLVRGRGAEPATAGVSASAHPGRRTAQGLEQAGAAPRGLGLPGFRPGLDGRFPRLPDSSQAACGWRPGGRVDHHVWSVGYGLRRSP